MVDRLCARYWYPLYAYLRKRGNSSADAQVFTQGFLCKMLERDGLAKVDRNRGHLRSYMIEAMNHFLSDERQKERAQRRGGGGVVLGPSPKKKWPAQK
jgi:RNA polymerase sigma-70 factor (ECF subfamily)